MYQSNSTNGSRSAAISHSHVHLQHDLFSDDAAIHDGDQMIIQQVFDHYRQELKSSPQILLEIINRKINPDFVDRFGIGYSNRTLGYELQSPKILLGDRNRGHLQRLGILKESGHEFFQGSLIIPYTDKGKIIGAYGRKTKHQRRSPAYHLYWNAERVSFFNANEKLPGDLILCKSALDCLTLLTAGFNNAVATMGMKGFNEVQLSRLANDRVSKVFIAFDNTPSGNQYALLVAQVLHSVKVKSYRINLPVGLDVNAWARLNPNFSQSFANSLGKAVDFKPGYKDLSLAKTSQWLNRLDTIGECIQFYFQEWKSSSKSDKTFNSYRIHLDRFLEFCLNIGVELIIDLDESVLEAYQYYLQDEKNIFTGKVISVTTKTERIDAVRRLLRRLHYFGIIDESIDFVAIHRGTVH
jgi:Toprim-like